MLFVICHFSHGQRFLVLQYPKLEISGVGVLVEGPTQTCSETHPQIFFRKVQNKSNRMVPCVASTNNNIHVVITKQASRLYL